MSYIKNLAQIQTFLLFRIVLNKDTRNLLRLGTAFKKPTAFNDPIAFKNLLRLMIRKGRPTSLG